MAEQTIENKLIRKPNRLISSLLNNQVWLIGVSLDKLVKHNILKTGKSTTSWGEIKKTESNELITERYTYKLGEYIKTLKRDKTYNITSNSIITEEIKESDYFIKQLFGRAFSISSVSCYTGDKNSKNWNERNKTLEQVKL